MIHITITTPQASNADFIPSSFYTHQKFKHAIHPLNGTERILPFLSSLIGNVGSIYNMHLQPGKSKERKDGDIVINYQPSIWSNPIYHVYQSRLIIASTGRYSCLLSFSNPSPGLFMHFWSRLFLQFETIHVSIKSVKLIVLDIRLSSRFQSTTRILHTEYFVLEYMKPNQPSFFVQIQISLRVHRYSSICHSSNDNKVVNSIYLLM